MDGGFESDPLAETTHFPAIPTAGISLFPATATSDEDCAHPLRTDSSSSMFGSDDSRSTTTSGRTTGSSGSCTADSVPSETEAAAAVASLSVEDLMVAEFDAVSKRDDVVSYRCEIVGDRCDVVNDSPDAVSGRGDVVSEPVSDRCYVVEGREERVRERCLGKGRALAWGSTSVIGGRMEMEDAFAVLTGFLRVACEVVGGCAAMGSRDSCEPAPLGFFGVYDGHGGPQVANFCSERMHSALAEEWETRSGPASPSTEGWQKWWEGALSRSFLRVDGEITGAGDEVAALSAAAGAAEPIAPEIVGSTAVVVVVSGCQIIASNCGDSRAVLCRGNQAIPLTLDHKPDREDELERIEAAGGKVINWNGSRVFGVLAMSRAIGDRYLRPSIIPDPEVSFTPRTDEDECLVVASDGLWDVVSNEEACREARRVLSRPSRVLRDESAPTPSPSPAQAAAEHLANLAMHRHSSDNITIIVVDLKHRRRRLPQR
ncbi:probable protein phosphatase 2C 51 [Amborella trichopoda]|nr:probable protein phosphatase 2C 51 [Amborella trichopoda]|eukprot:XP_006853681.2 probable protein phosphatase 2C 51 [Amborella trichopoda]